MSLGDWPGLPPELQALILSRLEVADYLRFGAVCRSWCSTVAQRPCLPKPRIPWLMVSDGNRDPDIRCFFDHLDQMYQIHLPEIHGRFPIGSSEGWLITVDELSELHALNPLTRESSALPSITTFSDVRAVRDSDGRLTAYVRISDNIHLFDDLHVPPMQHTVPVEHMRKHYYSKAILHRSSAGSGHTVVVIHGESKDLAFAHIGNESWTELPQPEPMFFQDMIFRNGLLHAVSTGGDVMVFDTDAPGSPIVTSIAKPDHETWPGCYNKKYLVESPDGEDLFQVWRDSRRFSADRDDPRESYLPSEARVTIEFIVFKLDGRRNEWSKVEHLGDLALFLGLNRSLALSAHEFPELVNGYIHFTGDYDDYKEECMMERRVIHDVGAFNLKDGNFHDSKWICSPQVWITPALFSSR